MKTSIFLKMQYGVIVELRLHGNQWLDRYATRWIKFHDSETWQSQGFHKISAEEIGRWTSDTHDVYATVKAAGSNDSGFRNWGAM